VFNRSSIAELPNEHVRRRAAAVTGVAAVLHALTRDLDSRSTRDAAVDHGVSFECGQHDLLQRLRVDKFADVAATVRSPNGKAAAYGRFERLLEPAIGLTVWSVFARASEVRFTTMHGAGAETKNQGSSTVWRGRWFVVPLSEVVPPSSRLCS
jgi:hypothetical protein